MTSDTAPAGSGRRRSRKQEKKSLWQMDISSIGRKDTSDTDGPVDRPPFTATLPSVDLLPQHVRESMSLARIRKWTAIVIVVMLVAVGALWWLQGSTIDRARDDLAAAKAQNRTLQAQVAALAPVKQMYEQITRLQNVVTTTLAAQPQASVVIDRLAQAGTQVTGEPITLSNTDVTYTGIPQPGDALSTCPNPDPFGTAITVGCLTFSATATDRDQVSQLLRLLEDDPLFVGPYVTSSTATEVQAGAKGNKTSSVVAFSGSAGISLEALSTALTQEEIDAILAPPAEAAGDEDDDGDAAEGETGGEG